MLGDFAPTADQHDQSRETSALEPLLVDFAGLAKLLCRSVASLYRDRAAGRLGVEPVRLCGSVRFSVEEVRAWVAAGCPTRRAWEAIKATQNSGRR